jgi:nucleotidyltransferase substrate binding protein (TIGR01987 family)
MNQPDIRWQQRLQNYRKALAQLNEAVDLGQQRELSRLEQQGVIQGFEYTYELAWNTLKDYLQWQGIQGLVGSRDTFREAFNKSLIHDGDTWMAMLLDRSRTAHTYNEDTAKSILQSICDRYITLFNQLDATMTLRATQQGL